MYYGSIFFVSLISASVFPLGSEALFAYYATISDINISILLFFATLGNTLGSATNYYFGRKGLEYLQSKNLLKQTFYDRSVILYQKYGVLALLFSWVPIIGDPITLVAGMLRINFYLFFVVVAFAKFARYYAIILLL